MFKIKGSSILVTGGTGSFGRAFARKALDFGCGRLRILSRGEHAQAEMRSEFGDDKRLGFFIGDVRDRDRLRRAFEGVDLVIHAAALKRIEVGHYDPIEVVKTNVNGAINVIEAGHAAGVQRGVGLSSDKAYQPVSPYGCSKAMAESLFLAANNSRGARGPIFGVTRYGNISGSNGSVIPKWRKMIANKATIVPVTDPEVTRFWMTLDEAVNLVMDTAVDMEGGELAIPELPAYRLGDLASAMGVGMNVTGLPDWEKRHEGLRSGLTSDLAPRMSILEIQEGLSRI